MSSRTIMTIEIRQDVKEQLDALASSVDQSSQRLAEDAVTAFVERELALRQSIERSLEQGRAGNTIDHSDAIAEMRAMIAAVRGERAARG